MQRIPLTDEKELLLRLKEGDEVVFTRIYHHYHPFLYSLAYKLTGDEDESNDIIQDIFIKFWQKRAQLDIQGMLLGYLQFMVRNCFLNRERDRGTWSRYQADLMDYLKEERLPVEEYVFERELIVRLEQIAATLPGKMGQVFLMTHFQHFSEAEIALALGISEKTVKNLLSMAMGNVKVQLGLSVLLFLLQP
ncbi:RNA polymerase, sigma subunit, SigY [bacterium A37T11]|nr:RNA polymerase, sigma subunit, SigY [bacterium A37T11]